SSLLLATLLLTLTSFCVAAQAQNAGVKTIAFTVSMPKPHTHLFDVEIRIANDPSYSPSRETLVMPVWTPGSYLIREFERHVQDFEAVDAAGHALAWEKIN